MNGRVHTGRRTVEALLVEEGRVVLAGSSDQVRRAGATGTVWEDLQGRLLLPGLIDAHLHLRPSVLSWAGTDLSASLSVQQCLDRFTDQLQHDGAGPVLGYGWDETKFPATHRLTRQTLDRLETERAVVAIHHSLHLAVANSAALDALGLDGDSVDPPGGRIGRLGSTLDGRLYEEAVRPIAQLEGQAFAASEEGLDDWFRGAASLGLTTVAPMAVDPADLERLRARYGPAGPPLRVRGYVPSDASLPTLPRPSEGDSSEVRVVGIKLFLDGALGPRSARLSIPYADDPTTRGSVLDGARVFDEVLERAGESGLQVAVHAIGDEAVRQALRTIRHTSSTTPTRIEHASMTPPDLLKQLGEVRPAVVVQPMFRQSDPWILERLGPERARWTYALRSLVDLGIPIAGSSDAPVETLDPWRGMAAACAPRPGGREGEELTVAEAVGLYTAGAAGALREPQLGSLEPGALADLIVLDAPDLAGALRLGASAVRSTYRSGEPTFVRSASSESAGRARRSR